MQETAEDVAVEESEEDGIEPMDPDALQELKDERQPLRVSPDLYSDPESVEISPGGKASCCPGSTGNRRPGTSWL